MAGSRGAVMVVGALMLGLMEEGSGFTCSLSSYLHAVSGYRRHVQLLHTARPPFHSKSVQSLAMLPNANGEVLAAIEEEDVGALKELLVQGVETNFSDEWGTTVLQLAVKQGNVEVQLLLHVAV